MDAVSGAFSNWSATGWDGGNTRSISEISRGVTSAPSCSGSVKSVAKQTLMSPTVGVLYSKPRNETKRPGSYAESAILAIVAQSSALMPSMNRHPPSCHVAQSYWPWSLPETACSVMHATSMPAARMWRNALWGSPSASPEMKLWLCRSVCTSSSDLERSNRERRAAPVVPGSPPRVEASAGRTARPPPAKASALSRVRRSMGSMAVSSTTPRAAPVRGVERPSLPSGGAGRCAPAPELLLDPLHVEVVAPTRHAALLVDVDQRHAFHLHRPTGGRAARREGAAADPLEHRPVVLAPDRGHLLRPVREERLGLLRHLREVIGRLGLGRVDENGVGGEQSLEVGVGPMRHVQGALDPSGPCIPVAAHDSASRDSIASRISSDSGSTSGLNRRTGSPEPSTRNFSKFHRMSPETPSASARGVSTS